MQQLTSLDNDDDDEDLEDEVKELKDAKELHEEGEEEMEIDDDGDIDYSSEFEQDKVGKQDLEELDLLSQLYEVQGVSQDKGNHAELINLLQRTHLLQSMF